MNYLALLTLIFGLIFFRDIQGNPAIAAAVNPDGTIHATRGADDEEEIQTLIRQVLHWANSTNSIDLLPIVSKDSMCIGFDLAKHNLNLEKLKATHLFADEFIENYDEIIQTLDRKIKSNELEEWNIYELPPFSFASDVNPWCLCQDVPYDEPAPWDFVETELVKQDKTHGEFDWKWGSPRSAVVAPWNGFAYRFRVVKENDTWKIAYLQGFDFKESTGTDE